MKFKIDHDYVPVNVMRFRLLSKNIQFRCITPPDPSKEFDLSSFYEPNEAEFIFDDSREVDHLIEMLKKFKDECGDRIGEWKRDGYR